MPHEPKPAMPHICGSTTPCTSAQAMPASTALPPSRSTSAPASVGSGCGATIIACLLYRTLLPPTSCLSDSIPTVALAQYGGRRRQREALALHRGQPFGQRLQGAVVRMTDGNDEPLPPRH